MGDVWPMVHAERAALLTDLEDLDAARWEEPSLCGEWTVHDVVAHLVDTARTTRLGHVASRRSTPPAPLDSRLVEEVVHGEDIRRPLGLIRSYPREAVVRSLRLHARTPASFGGAKELVAGVRLTQRTPTRRSATVQK